MSDKLTADQISDLMAYAEEFAAIGLPRATYDRMKRLCRIAGISIDDAIEAAR